MLIDKSARVWAMRPGDLMASHALQARQDRMNGVEAAGRGEPLEGSGFARVVDGVAVIPVAGPLVRTQSPWMWSYEEIARDVQLAQADERVRAIVLDIDSPGGLAAGVGDLAEEIRASGPKPIEAFVGGLAASAGYYVAAAADRITLGSGAAVGSIGTVIEYVDMEPILEKMGARIVRVVAEQSPNKRLDADSAEGRAELQALVDAGGAEFVKAVARFRGVSESEVLDRFGQGLVFGGYEALDRGMADRAGTLSDLIAELAGRDFDMQKAVAATAETQEDSPMNWDELTAEALRDNRPDVAEAIEKAAAEAAAEAAEAARKEGADAERERILAIEEIAIEGHADLIAAAKADGETTAADLALEIVKAEKASGASHIAARQEAEAEIDVPAAPVEEAAPVDAGASLEDRARMAWDQDEKLRAEFGGNLDAYMSFERAAAHGAARILSRAN